MVLKDALTFKGLGHHIKDIMHHCSSQFQVEMTLDPLLRNSAMYVS
jgi:hypothetical protein